MEFVAAAVREREGRIALAQAAQVGRQVDQLAGDDVDDIAFETVFPPVWGPRSYNWGAGMARINNAAGFIKANMPLSEGGKLTIQQAWDVAAYVDGKPRPQDPRYAGSVAATRAKFQDTAQSMYGRIIDGIELGGDGPPKQFGGPQSLAQP
jgi:cytochrome c